MAVLVPVLVPIPVANPNLNHDQKEIDGSRRRPCTTSTTPPPTADRCPARPLVPPHPTPHLNPEVPRAPESQSHRMQPRAISSSPTCPRKRLVVLAVVQRPSRRKYWHPTSEGATPVSPVTPSTLEPTQALQLGVGLNHQASRSHRPYPPLPCPHTNSGCNKCMSDLPMPATLLLIQVTQAIVVIIPLRRREPVLTAVARLQLQVFLTPTPTIRLSVSVTIPACNYIYNYTCIYICV